MEKPKKKVQTKILKFPLGKSGLVALLRHSSVFVSQRPKLLDDRDLVARDNSMDE